MGNAALWHMASTYGPAVVVYVGIRVDMARLVERVASAHRRIDELREDFKGVKS